LQTIILLKQQLHLFHISKLARGIMPFIHVTTGYLDDTLSGYIPNFQIEVIGSL